MRKIEYVKICPKCRSLNISIVNKITMGFLPSEYICNNCKYTGFIFPEINVNKIKKLKKK